MHIQDLVLETRAALTANPLRTFLTVLGIVIGIASVIVMLSIGQGAQDSINSRISSLGSNVLTVSPSGGGNRPGGVAGTNSNSLKLADAEAIEKLPLVDKIAPVVSSRTQVIAGSKNTNVTVYGSVPQYMDIRSIEMDEGSFISEIHNTSYAKVAVLGPTTRDNLFNSSVDPVGQKIKINSSNYTVIGVTKSKGGTGFGNMDESVYIPLKTAMQYISGGDTVNSISVTTKSSNDMTTLQNSITELLLTRHKIKNKDLADFNVFNQADLASTAASVATTFTILLGSVAGISLLVGGIGIMNMMLTTVRERTKEIGLRKAIGARRKDISRQFLIESIVVTSLGGVIGIMLGVGISYLIRVLNLFSTSISFNSVILSFCVSAGIGIIFGYYPAKKASELNPIEALRYE